MAKRKLGVYSENTSISNSNHSKVQQQQDRLKNSLEHAKKSLVRALKLARGFERQKLGRRQKTAKESNEGLETTRRLDAEVSALKALDLFDVAESYIFKSMVKVKAISSAPGFPHHIISKLSSATPLQEPARTNVLARLFSSSVVKTSMADIMAGIEKILGTDDILSKRKKRRRATDFANDTIVVKNHLASVGTTISDEQIQPGLGNTYGVNHVPRTDSGSSNHERPTSERADSFRNGSANESFVQEMSSEASDDKGHFYQQASLSSSHSSILSVPQTFESRPQKASVSKSKCTTFLPSLSIGGYISNSDSDSVDLLPSLSEKIDIKPRKNRRGQQERRKIWEKKFGMNANHLKRNLENQSNDQDWTSQPGTQSKYSGSAFRRGRSQKSQNNPVKPRGGGPISSGANSDPVKARVKPNAKIESGKSLHPSWEAAKKAKETEKNIAFRGKKIVFN